MLIDKQGLHFTKNNIIGNERQITITIPKRDWKYYPVGSRVKLISKKGIYSIRKVMELGCGKQRYINISKQDRDIFIKGDMVKIYPLKQQKVSQ